MSEWAIEVTGLRKSFGPVRAVDGLDMRVTRGAVYGFIGPNGAGKTTTLRLLAGLLEADAGEVRLNGTPVPAEPRAARMQIGFMPDFFGLYGELQVWECLDFYARCYGLPASERTSRVEALLHLVKLHEVRDEDVGVLSRGMLQRLGLARALIHDPQILLLDEPASGLDPRARVEMREILRQLAGTGKTIVISSHILAELADMCTEIGIIDRGRLVVEGDWATVQARLRAGRRVLIRTLTAPEAVRPLLGGFDGVLQAELASQREPWAWRVDFEGDERALAGLLTHLTAHGVAVVEFRETGRDLEQLYLELTREEVSWAGRQGGMEADA
ncbi:MAG: ABC transporter ATP-binding protein [Anaerolineae bacterium]